MLGCCVRREHSVQFFPIIEVLMERHNTDDGDSNSNKLPRVGTCHQSTIRTWYECTRYIPGTTAAAVLPCTAVLLSVN